MLRNPAVKVPVVDELRKISDDLGLKCDDQELKTCSGNSVFNADI